MDNLITQLFDVYYSKYNDSYAHLTNIKDLELISFSFGILLILETLKIKYSEINTNEGSIKELLDTIIKGYLKEDLKLTDEEKLNDFISDQNNVNIREYVPSRN